MAELKKIKVNLDSLYMDGTKVDAFISELQKAKTKYAKKGYADFTLEREDEGYGEPYHVWYLAGERIETVAEATAREAKEKEAADRQLFYQRQQFEALKKKFGNDQD